MLPLLAVSRQKVMFSSAVPSGSGAFQIPTRPSSSSSASSASTLRGYVKYYYKFKVIFD